MRNGIGWVAAQQFSEVFASGDGIAGSERYDAARVERARRFRIQRYVAIGDLTGLHEIAASEIDGYEIRHRRQKGGIQRDGRVQLAGGIVISAEIGVGDREVVARGRTFWLGRIKGDDAFELGDGGGPVAARLGIDSKFK